MKVFVLLFNSGTKNEGIYTFKHGERNTVFMLEEEEDASHYALLLEKQDFPKSTIESFEREDIEIFCQEAGYGARLIPPYYDPQSGYERQIVIPPSTNLEKFDWNG